MTLYFFVFGERQLFDNQVGLLPYLGDLKFKLLYCYWWLYQNVMVVTLN